MTSEACDGGFTAHTCSCRAFREEYCNCLPEKRVLQTGWDKAGLDCGLVSGGIADQSHDLLWCEVGDGEQVARCEGGGLRSGR